MCVCVCARVMDDVRPRCEMRHAAATSNDTEGERKIQGEKNLVAWVPARQAHNVANIVFSVLRIPHARCSSGYDDVRETAPPRKRVMVYVSDLVARDVPCGRVDVCVYVNSRRMRLWGR